MAFLMLINYKIYSTYTRQFILLFCPHDQQAGLWWLPGNTRSFNSRWGISCPS